MPITSMLISFVGLTVALLNGRATASPLVLQVSDIHTSQHQRFRSHRERHEDFQMFSALFAPRLEASAALLTGDLVDSKSPDGVSAYQSEWEWIAYQSVTEVLTASLKPSLQVLADVRGNHDAYNIPLRAAPGDHYIKYGRSKELISDRVAVKDVLDSKGCIALQILLLDAVPAVGYRSYLNFLTTYTPSMLRDVDAALWEARNRIVTQQQDPTSPCSHNSHSGAPTSADSNNKAKGGDQPKRNNINTAVPVPLMAAQHHPISVLQQPGMHAKADPSSVYKRRLQSILAHHSVQVFVSGHLHDIFGDRQHACHAVSDLEWLAGPAHSAFEAQGNDTVLLDAQEVPKGSKSNRRCILELEAPGWRSSRHFRMMTFENGVFSSTDARLIILRNSTTDSGSLASIPEEGTVSLPILSSPPKLSLPTNLSADIHVRADDPSALASPYLIHIVSPPDARYFPTVAAPATWSLMRVHVVATWTFGMHVRNGKLLSASAEPPSHMHATFTCMRQRGYWRQLWASTMPLSTASDGSHEHRGDSKGAFEAHAALPEATIAAAEKCRAEGNSLTVQVFATHATLGISYSEVRPIHAKVAEGTSRDPLGNSNLEKLVVGIRWTVIGNFLLYPFLLLHIVVVILGRVLRKQLASQSFVMHDPHAYALVHCHGKTNVSENGADSSVKDTAQEEEQQEARHNIDTASNGVEMFVPGQEGMHANHACGDNKASTNGTIKSSYDLPTGATPSANACSTVASGNASLQSGRQSNAPLTYMQAMHCAIKHMSCAVGVIFTVPLRQHAEFAHWEGGWKCLLGYLMWLAVAPVAVVQPLDHSRLGFLGMTYACLPAPPEATEDSMSEEPSVSKSALHSLSDSEQWLSQAPLRCQWTVGPLLCMSPHYLLVVAPMLLWMVSVVSRWRSGQHMQRMHASSIDASTSGNDGIYNSRLQKTPSRFLTWGDIVPLMWLLYMHGTMITKYTPLLGWWLVFLGPGFGWAPHVAVLLLVFGFRSTRQ